MAAEGSNPNEVSFCITKPEPPKAVPHIMRVMASCRLALPWYSGTGSLKK